ncbi:YpjP family protein [Brevibacillus sp. 179-C9.3 HS]|uniref:YpjP family protein n=1 Tax=unclassified Brevibacillus TaxID=2684853 RepID=UPI0039A188FD
MIDFIKKGKKLFLTSLASMMLFSTTLTSSFAAETDILTKSSVNEMLQYEFSSEVMTDDKDRLEKSLTDTFENLDIVLIGMKHDKDLREAFLEKTTLEDEVRRDLEEYLSSSQDDEAELNKLIQDVKDQIVENHSVLPEITEVLLLQSNSSIKSEEKVQATILPILLRFALKEAVKKKMGKKIQRMAYDEFEERIESEIWAEVEALHQQYDGDIDYEGPESKNARNGINQGEKVFNIINKRNNKDLLRFHMKRVDDGRSIDFHWHKRDDNFKWHHGQTQITRNNQFPDHWGED